MSDKIPTSDAIHVFDRRAVRLHRDRAAGEGNAVRLRDRRIPSAALFPAALAALPTQDGRIPATLRLAMLTGWAPAASQPKPLPRGSAKISLVDALRGDADP